MFTTASPAKKSLLGRKNYWSERILTDGSSLMELWRSMSSLLQRERTADALIRFVMWICHYLEGKETWSQNFYNSMMVAAYFTCMFIGLRSVMPLINEYWLIDWLIDRAFETKTGWSIWITPEAFEMHARCYTIVCVVEECLVMWRIWRGK